jgi:sialic acid synthase SpsE
VKIGSWSSDSGRCFVIAEAGSNHDGKLEQARALVDVAAAAGADAVKFQSFKASRMYPPTGGQVAYLAELGIAQPIYELVEQLELPDEWVPVLAKHATDRGIQFLVTPFDEAAVDLIRPFVPAYKIASYELTHLPLVQYAARDGKPMILSTGGATLGEVRNTVDAVREINRDIVVLQCTAKYPAPIERMDLRAMDELGTALGVPVGLSDHSQHPLHAPFAAAARGAVIIEKHFTLSRDLPGPDHPFAVEPDELTEMVRGIRAIEAALGDPHKRARDVERELIDYRRGIFTTTGIAAGGAFTRANTAVLRRAGVPTTGLEPNDYEDLLRKRASRALPAWQLLAPTDASNEGP